MLPWSEQPYPGYGTVTELSSVLLLGCANWFVWSGVLPPWGLAIAAAATVVVMITGSYRRRLLILVVLVMLLIIGARRKANQSPTTDCSPISHRAAAA